MAHVVLLGGTGFLGSNLALGLKERGFALVFCSRNPDAAREKINLEAEYVPWDGKDWNGWKSYAEGAQAIVNLTGENISSGRWTQDRKKRLYNSRMKPGEAVYEAVRSLSHPPKVVVQASAVGYYGSRHDEVLDERSGRGRGFLSDLCLEWEKSSKAVESLGVRHVIIRSGLVLGRQAGVLPRFIKTFRLFIGGPLGNGRQWFSWIHAADETAAILFLMERENLSGVFNLTSPCPVRMKEFARYLGKVMKRPSRFAVPSVLLRLLFGEMALETILASQRAMPTRLVEAGFLFSYPDLEKALQHILAGHA
jgi:uncharacterized protein (TIGR01777 family)